MQGLLIKAKLGCKQIFKEFPIFYSEHLATLECHIFQEPTQKKKINVQLMYVSLAFRQKPSSPVIKQLQTKVDWQKRKGLGQLRMPEEADFPQGKRQAL